MTTMLGGTEVVMRELMKLVEEAKYLAGAETTCQAVGHDWQTDGGRSCPTGNDRCSQPVFVCSRCGAHDYGDDDDGPGKTECRRTCGDSMTGWRPDWFEVPPNAELSGRLRRHAGE